MYQVPYAMKLPRQTIPRLSSSEFLFHITGYNIRWIRPRHQVSMSSTIHLLGPMALQMHHNLFAMLTTANWNLKAATQFSVALHIKWRDDNLGVVSQKVKSSSSSTSPTQTRHSLNQRYVKPSHEMEWLQLVYHNGCEYLIDVPPVKHLSTCSTINTALSQIAILLVITRTNQTWGKRSNGAALGPPGAAGAGAAGMAGAGAVMAAAPGAGAEGWATGTTTSAASGIPCKWTKARRWECNIRHTNTLPICLREA
jgi:hypothetical protein